MPIFSYGTGKLDKVEVTDSGTCRVCIVDDDDASTDTYEVEADPERRDGCRVELFGRLAEMTGRRVWMKYRVRKVWPDRGRPLSRRLLVDVDEIGDVMNTKSRYWEWSTLPVIGLISIALAVVLMVFGFTSAPRAGANQRLSRSDWVVANADINGNTEIIKFPLAGGSVVNLTNNSATDQDPSVSPDGTRIAFTSNRETGADNVWVMAADGSGATNLTFNALAPTASSRAPAWSPDGSQIAYTSDMLGDPVIWVMNADGSDPHMVSYVDGHGNNPSWSDDGNHLAFVSNNRVATIRSDGSDKTYLTDPGADGALYDDNPTYSPNGREIAFWRDSYPGGTHLMVMRADGSNLRQLETGTGTAKQPAWTSDGRSLVYSSDRDSSQPGVGASADLYSLNMQNNAVTRLTTHALSDGNATVHQMLAPTGIEPTVASYYFAEGTIRPGFAEYFTLQNPTDNPANVAIEFQAADDQNRSVNIPTLLTTVSAQSRTTVSLNDYARLNGVRQSVNVSARVTSDARILAERPLYFSVDPALGNRVSGGTTTVGATSLATVWDFAEGTFRPGFVQYFTVQNPNDDAADVTIRFQAADDNSRRIDVPDYHAVVEGHSRTTVNVNDYLRSVGIHGSVNLSASVISSIEIAVERPIYFTADVGAGSRVAGGSNAFGQRNS